MLSLGVVFDGRARTSAIPRRAAHLTVLLLFNAFHEDVSFRLPDLPGPDRWLLLIDTNQPRRDRLTRFTSGQETVVTGRSAVVMVLESAGPARDYLLELEAAVRGNLDPTDAARPLDSTVPTV